eukprot:566092-Alexandrium_andersonii.AAC.1
MPQPLGAQRMTRFTRRASWRPTSPPPSRPSALHGKASRVAGWTSPRASPQPVNAKSSPRTAQRAPHVRRQKQHEFATPRTTPKPTIIRMRMAPHGAGAARPPYRPRL